MAGSILAVTVGTGEAMAARSKRRSAHGTPRGVPLAAHEPSQEDARAICVGAHGTVSETSSLEFPLKLFELGERLVVSPCPAILNPPKDGAFRRESGPFGQPRNATFDNMRSVRAPSLAEEHLDHKTPHVPHSPSAPTLAARHESSLLHLQRSAGNQAVRQLLQRSAARPPTVHRQDEEDEAIAEGAGTVNAAGNIVGPIVDKAAQDVVAAEKQANELLQTAKADRSSAARKLRKAQKDVTNAARQTDKAKRRSGSGRRGGRRAMNRAASRTRKAQTAVAEGLSKLAAAARANTRALQALDEAKAAREALPRLVKLLDRVPLDQIGFAAAAIDKAITTKNTTVLGKGADALGTAGVDTAFSTALPIVAAADAIVGLVGGERYTISSGLSDSVSSTTGLTESILTGEAAGISSFHEASKNGENHKIFELAAEAGEYWAEQGDSEERVQTTGDFYGGADTVPGRAGAAIASVPGVGHAGQAVGWAAWQTYDKGGKALSATADAVETAHDFVMPEGRTLNPVVGIKSLLRGENPFW